MSSEVFDFGTLFNRHPVFANAYCFLPVPLELAPLGAGGGACPSFFFRSALPGMRERFSGIMRAGIAFPGGGVEDGEALEEAAVREAEEEVGIDRGSVELIGRLDDLITNSGFLVAPFVGTITTRIDYVLREAEVAEVFEVPMDALLRPAQPEVRYVSFRDRNYPAYFYQYDRYEIWGLTGRMLKAFLDLVWQAV